MKTSTSTLFKKYLDPKELLRQTLEERCKKNPQYSLRAFSRASGISHTVLSLVLSGKRRLSKKAILQLAHHLELDPQQSETLLQGSKGIRAEDFESLPLDTFELISDWYHYAILSLMELPDAKFEARWISQRLGLKPLATKLAMERLQRLQLIEKNSEGRWKQSGKPLKVDNTISTSATKKFHKQLLKRAAESIDADPISIRDFSSMTFTLDPSQVEYARERIRDFRRKLVAELEFKARPSAVYNMTIQLYPVTSTNPQGDLK